ncbi:glucan 1,3-beta-glucosidase isoform X2 [Cryptomeria japonica]|uniref:glucan 1,3-beta-glucosidase isoform X2 n=1 Tax=Cryptomeria japonica TaxID=3369 RepID=UPI0025ABF466|nr:glucan 1,3-beta-glucosidase isoform X2 [Cryptomeria japonica]
MYPLPPLSGSRFPQCPMETGVKNAVDQYLIIHIVVSMGIGAWKWQQLLFLLCLIPLASTTTEKRKLEGIPKVRAVNLGGWLVVEGWIKPSLFDDIKDNDLLDGTKVQFKSLKLNKYLSAEYGGGHSIVVDRDDNSTWETFKLWRVSDGRYQLKVFGGQFMTAENGGGGNVSAAADSPGDWETFDIVRHHKHRDRVHIRVFNGTYMQAQSEEQLTADYQGKPRWDDNAATFQMNIVANDLHGDYQLANGYGPKKAKSVYDKHRSSFITEKDFGFLLKNGINTVRIPVGWWIAYDPNPPAPFIGGSLQALDNAFTWAQKHDIRVIVDLHAAPGSQNGMEHSASRDGSADWANSTQHISQSLQIIDFLASRYGNNSMLLGIELLNEPLVTTVSVDVINKYYTNGYEIVRKHSSTAYVIMCQRIGKADPHELYQSNDVFSNVVVDVHYYNLFDPYYENLTAQENIDFILKNRQPELLALNSANGPLIFVGEWTNEWKVKGASREEYQRFGDAQLEVYEQASFGWSYWTLKNQDKHWDFEWNVQHKYLKSDESRASSCKNISWKIHTSFLLFGCLHLWIARII